MSTDEEGVFGCFWILISVFFVALYFVCIALISCCSWRPTLTPPKSPAKPPVPLCFEHGFLRVYGQRYEYAGLIRWQHNNHDALILWFLPDHKFRIPSKCPKQLSNTLSHVIATAKPPVPLCFEHGFLRVYGQRYEYVELIRWKHSHNTLFLWFEPDQMFRIPSKFPKLLSNALRTVIANEMDRTGTVSYDAAMSKMEYAISFETLDQGQTVEKPCGHRFHASGAYQPDRQPATLHSPSDVKAAGTPVVSNVKTCATSTLVPASESWKRATTKNGREYFYNIATKESSWTAPDEMTSKISPQHTEGSVDHGDQELGSRGLNHPTPLEMLPRRTTSIASKMNPQHTEGSIDHGDQEVESRVLNHPTSLEMLPRPPPRVSSQQADELSTKVTTDINVRSEEPSKITSMEEEAARSAGTRLKQLAGDLRVQWLIGAVFLCLGFLDVYTDIQFWASSIVKEYEDTPKECTWGCRPYPFLENCLLATIILPHAFIAAVLMKVQRFQKESCTTVGCHLIFLVLVVFSVISISFIGKGCKSSLMGSAIVRKVLMPLPYVAAVLIAMCSACCSATTLSCKIWWRRTCIKLVFLVIAYLIQKMHLRDFDDDNPSLPTTGRVVLRVIYGSILGCLITEPWHRGMLNGRLRFLAELPLLIGCLILFEVESVVALLSAPFNSQWDFNRDLWFNKFTGVQKSQYIAIRQFSLAVLEGVPQLALTLYVWLAIIEGSSAIEIDSQIESTSDAIKSIIFSAVGVVSAVAGIYTQVKELPNLSLLEYAQYLFAIRPKDDKYAVAVANMIRKSSPRLRGRTFALTYTSVSCAGVVPIGVALKDNTGLHTILLSHNQIKNKGCIALAEGLAANSNITTLRLDYNEIGDVGATSLSKAILSRVSSGYSSTQAQSDSPRHCTQDYTSEAPDARPLLFVSVEHNQIGDLGARSFEIIVDEVLTHGHLDASHTNALKMHFRILLRHQTPEIVADTFLDDKCNNYSTGCRWTIISREIDDDLSEDSQGSFDDDFDGFAEEQPSADICGLCCDECEFICDVCCEFSCDQCCSLSDDDGD